MAPSVSWVETFAARNGLRYEPDADERWLRAWEPYTTLKVPSRYEHGLLATGGAGSVSIARAIFELPPAPMGMPSPTEIGTWIAIVQDERLAATAATTSDFRGLFGDSLEHPSADASWVHESQRFDRISMRRRPTGDRAFDQAFASFAPDPEQLSRAVTPSVRKLLLSWRAPVHAEIRPGGFILAPVALAANDWSLAWFLQAIHIFGDKATKVADS